MYLERLEIAGFKSFARRTVFSFPDPRERGAGITAIVGPNGSGKSCVLDAIRWVLGEQSVKLLRGKKSEDVIFSGSTQRRAEHAAEVTLVLNNDVPPSTSETPSASTPEIEHALQASSVAISRVLDRSGTSEYLLNGERARLQDITMLLARIGLGSNTYSLIGQGMIDTLLLSTPKDWKEFFDDATGITPYRLKREATVRKIEATRANLAQAEALKAEIEPRVRSLGRQMKRFERREQFARELTDVEVRYYATFLGTARREHAALSAACQEYQQQLIDADRERLQLEQNFELLTKARGGSQMDELHEKMMALMRSREKLIASASKSVAGRTPLAASTSTTEQRLEQFKKEAEEVAAALERLQSVGDAPRLAAQLRAAIGKLHHVEESAKTDSSIEVSGELRQLDDELAELESAMRELRHQGAGEQERLLDAQRALTAQNQKRESLASSLEHARVEHARLEARKESLERELQTDVREEVRAQITHVIADGADATALSDTEAEEMRRSIQRLRHELELIGGIDEEVAIEYRDVNERYMFLTTQISDVTNALTSLTELLATLERTMEERFLTRFSEIQSTFTKTFSQLFGGGKARIQLVEEETPPTDTDTEATSYKLQATSSTDRYGILIEAQPPGKKVKSLAMLSGGEKALSAIALVAALIAVAPTPFVVLDEVDASLDEGNSARFADVLAGLSEQAQFIVITHNRSSMHKARLIYGITMGEDGVSQALSVSFKEAEALAPDAAATPS